jgi:hypothetical protein
MVSRFQLSSSRDLQKIGRIGSCVNWGAFGIFFSLLGALVTLGCSDQAQSPRTALAARDLSAIEMEEAIRSTLNEREILLRTEQLLPLMLGLHEGNVEGAARVFERDLSTIDKEDLRLFLAAWGAFDPKAALDSASEWNMKHHREYGVGVLVSDWGSRGGAAEAVHYLQEVSEWSVREKGFQELVVGWVLSGDVDGATDFIDDFKTTRGKDILQENLVRSLMRAQGVEGVIAWGDRVVAERKKKFRIPGFRKALRHAAHRNPSRAAEWWLQHKDEEWGRRSISAVVTEWAEQDPLAALAWIRQLPESIDQSDPLAKLSLRWSNRDLYGMSKWIKESIDDEISDSERRYLVFPFVKQAALFDPVLASEFVEYLNREGDVWLSVAMIVREWTKQDPISARAWLSSQDVPTRVRYEALGIPPRRPPHSPVPNAPIADETGEENPSDPR